MSGRRTRRDATIAERLLHRIRVIDAAHPLFGQRLEVSPSGLIRRIGWIRVVLPDGRHRWVLQKATDLNVSACEVRPDRGLHLIDITLHPALFLLCLLMLQKWTVRYFWPTMRRWLR